MKVEESKAGKVVADFFAKQMRDPEVNKRELLDLISVSVGSTIALYLDPGSQEKAMVHAMEALQQGFEVGMQMKPIADAIRDGKTAPGLFITIIEHEKNDPR
ncbi:hypothetical protein ACFSR7_12445 [Cohnella sp. GCM10020058]|uniref:hypothetical protein n=1 Tax=Cohnella sp. GCM10020058 TaxID=3317330 RepID=UPI003632614A